MHLHLKNRTRNQLKEQLKIFYKDVNSQYLVRKEENEVDFVNTSVFIQITFKIIWLLFQIKISGNKVKGINKYQVQRK